MTIPSSSPMKWKAVLSPSLLALLALSTPALAAPPTHLFLGTDLGYGTVTGYSPTEGDRSGIQYDLKALGSFYFPWLIFDAGFGWQYGKRSGTDPNGAFRKTFSRGIFLESSLRFGKADGWQIGPTFNYFFNGDVGLGDGRFTASQEKKAFYGGAQLFYEIPQKGYRMRLGGRWMIDLNVPQRTAQIIQGSFEIGIPLGGGKAAGPRYVNRREGFTIVQKERALKRLKVVLDARRIEFDYDKSTLRPEGARRLATLGNFLSQHLDKWESMRISGHTDERGSHEYNQKLSEDRAAAVKNALARAGIPYERMTSRGYSESMPIDPRHNEYAWARNRRVEFEFSGVQDMDLIIDGVNQSTDQD